MKDADFSSSTFSRRLTSQFLSGFLACFLSQAATQLGGALALDGGKVVFAHRDKAVADHVDLQNVLQALAIT